MDKQSVLFYVVLLLFAGTGIVTLLGLVQKVTIEKKYLNALFFALILELVAAVLYLFSNTDFFRQASESDELVVTRSDLPQAQRNLTGDELVTLLEKQAIDQQRLTILEQEITGLRDSIAAQVQTNDEMTRALDAKIAELDALRAAQDAARDNDARVQKLEKQFLVRMASLNALISEWGTSINFSWKPEEKRDIARRLQEAFKQIGFMDDAEEPDDDPARAQRILVDYQRSKDFGETGFLTSEVIAFIIRDYLAPVSIDDDSSVISSGR